ncbi:MAG: hypothetical protein WCL24_13355 [Verrucomicrobiota bacterium]
MNTSKKIALAAALALSVCVGSYSQTPPVAPPVAPVAPRPPVKIDLSKLSPEMQAMVTQLQAQAASLHAVADALRDQLKDKTAEQRKAIIDQFRKDNAALIDAQRDLAKQIRAEMKLLREQHKTG